MQSSFWENRIVVSWGQRSDAVDVQDAPTLAPSSNFLGLATGDIPWETIRSQKPTTRLTSVVVHPLPWISLSAARTNSEQVSSRIRRDIDGSLATFGSGDGREYGLTLRWRNKLSLRIAKYETIASGTLSSQRSPRPTPTLAAKGNIIRNDVANIENSVRLAGAPPSTRFGYYTDELARQHPTGTNAGAQFQELFELISDQVAKGYEATLVGNPTDSWRVAVSLAKNETAEFNIGPQYFEFIKERLPVWASYRDEPLAGAPTVTVGQLLPLAMQSWRSNIVIK